MKFRKRLKPEQAKSIGLKPKEKKGRSFPQYHVTQEQADFIDEFKTKTATTTATNQYRNEDKDFKMYALDDNGRVMDIDKYCEYYNLPRKDITSWKLVSHTGKPFYNIAFREQVEKLKEEIDFEEFFDSIPAPAPVPLEIQSCNPFSNALFDRVVITDLHVGMDVNPDGLGLYGGNWNAEELERRRNLTVRHILANRRAPHLVIDDLGDLLDGFNGQTIRGGHDLPQNMNNREAFETAVSFKIALVDDLAPRYESILIHNICDDNHSGDFAYMANSAFKRFIEARYDHVEVVNVCKFMYHYVLYGKPIIITHGKDSKNLKFGFKAHPDGKAIEKITEYIEHNNLNKYVGRVEFCKGDSHQYIFDHTSGNTFDYFSFPAFSPASNWVQTNFKAGRSGMVFFNYLDYDKTVQHPLFF